MTWRSRLRRASIPGALVGTLLFPAACADAPTAGSASSDDTPTTAFVNVTVIPMAEGAPETILPHRTVLVQDGRILSVLPTGASILPAGVRRIDGTGLFLMPGLADMHVHISSLDLSVYVAHGITMVRNCWGWEGLQGHMARAEAGEIVSPTIHSLSPGVDGTPPSWPQTQIIMDPSEAPALVERLTGDGWPVLKMYQNLRLDVYNAVAAAAKERGVPFSGHVPHRVGIDRVLEAGQDCIEHLSGYEVAITAQGGQGYPAWFRIHEDRIPALVGKTVEAGTWNCPTLAIFIALAGRQPAASREAMAANRRQFVKALYDAGAPLLAGTDSGIDVVAPGSSLFDELAEFHRAGIPREQVLRIATREAARYLGESGEWGAVETGMRADLMLLDGNPLEDLTPLRAPLGTMVRGRWYPAPRYAASSPPPMNR